MCVCACEKRRHKKGRKAERERKKNFCSVTQLSLTTVDFSWIIKKEDCHPVMFTADQTGLDSYMELESS